MALLFSIGACTDGFEEINQNPNEITNESLKQDFQIVGSKFRPVFSNIFGTQIHHNLSNESWAQHLQQPTIFTGNVNNTTYFIRWNPNWNRTYNNIMSPTGLIMLQAEEAELPLFIEWAKLFRIIAISRLTAFHGPVIYTDFGESTASYDSEPDLYNALFADLDTIQAYFNANIDAPDLGEFDTTYGGDLSKWVTFINSLRLRLAMRISKVAPALAKAQGEKALNDPGGLITANEDNFNVFLYGNVYHPVTISFGWDDTRMGATMESVLVGYEDPRISKFFDPVDASLVPDHPAYPYKGIRSGASLDAKGDHTPYSTISSDFKTVTSRRLLGAAEVEFIKAEAVLRGWTSPALGTAQEHYENGVKRSFEEWGAGGVDAYLADDTSLPIDYDDIVYNPGDRNDFVNSITATIMWNDADDNEMKLEKIITQKWIAARTNTMEAWVDHRRTGYPKLPNIYENNSSTEHGVLADDEFLRRVVFTDGQRANNAAAVAEATGFLGGPDEIGTRLWWDTGGPNF